jgi:hypothetical protein
MKKLAILALVMAAIFIVMQGVAVASFTTIDDNTLGATTYWGGTSGAGGGATTSDIIGSPAAFGINAMTVDAGGGVMTVRVLGPYFDFSPFPALGSGPGDLFIDLEGWNPAGLDAHHAEDSMLNHGQPWELVFNLENSALYNVADGSIVASNLSSGYRHNQEWLFDPNDELDYLVLGSWNITDDVLTMTFPITGTPIYGGQTLGLHWTMQCANDVVAGSAKVPEPSTMLLLGAGMLGLAFFARKK